MYVMLSHVLCICTHACEWHLMLACYKHLQQQRQGSILVFPFLWLWYCLCVVSSGHTHTHTPTHTHTDTHTFASASGDEPRGLSQVVVDLHVRPEHNQSLDQVHLVHLGPPTQTHTGGDSNICSSDLDAVHVSSCTAQSCSHKWRSQETKIN